MIFRKIIIVDVVWRMEYMNGADLPLVIANCYMKISSETELTT